MTLLLSLTHPDGIVMAADSRKTTTVTPADFETMEPAGQPRDEYEKTNKLFTLSGLGCVTMWGDITRIEDKVGPFLAAKKFDSIEDLAEGLLAFLKMEVVTDTDNDVGFHVGGYSKSCVQALYHVFFGKDVGPGVDPNNNPQSFKKYDHSKFIALYNGKHDIAHSLITFIRLLEEEVGIVKWITSFPIEKAIRFADFVLRYASQIDPTVGDDIKIALIMPANKIEVKTNISKSRAKAQTGPNKEAVASPHPSGVSMDDMTSEGTVSR